jgi:lipopolysaccharide transport protein LptA
MKGLANCKLQIANCRLSRPVPQRCTANTAPQKPATLRNGTAQFAICNALRSQSARRTLSLCLLLPALLLSPVGCGREKSSRRERPNTRQAAVAKKEPPGGTVTAEGSEMEWRDEQDRPLLVVKMASVTGSGSPTTGTAGPMTMRGAECRLFEEGKPTTWLKAPEVVWDNGHLLAPKGATAGSVDGRMTTRARTARWTSKQRLLDLEAPVCEARRPGEATLVAEGPSATWSGGLLTLSAGVKAHTSDGLATMQAERMRWRAATGALQAGGHVAIQRTGAEARCEQLQGDTRIRRVQLTGSPRIDIVGAKSLKETSGTTRGRARAAWDARRPSWAMLLALGIGVTPAAAAPAQQRRDVPAQGIVLVADRMMGDWVALNLELVGKASLTSLGTVMTSERMALKGEKGGNRIASATATGSVRLRTPREDGGTLTATGAAATYLPAEDRATLTGGIGLQFTSPRLAEPATVTGDRLELALSTGKAVVYRTAAAPVTVLLKPKGGEAPVELHAARVEVDTRGGAVSATGDPVMKHPQGTLAADKIWFDLDKATSDVREAHAAGNVRIHAVWEDGRTAQGSSERATFERAEHRITMEGSVQLTQNAPELEAPRKLTGETVKLDLKTRQVDVLSGNGKQAEFTAPFTPKPAKGPTNANQHR